MDGKRALLALLAVVAKVHGSHALTLNDGAVLLQSSARSAATSARWPQLITDIVSGRGIAELLIEAVEVSMASNSSGMYEPAFKGFRCDLHPAFCKEPFNCNTVTSMTAARWLEEGLAVDGPNPSVLCTLPTHELYFEQCMVKRDLIKAAHLQYFFVRQGLKEEGAYDTDASLCFMEGLCVEDSITANSTAEDGAAACDRRYGHYEWTRFGSKHTDGHYTFSSRSKGQIGEGLASRWESIPFALSSCATGTFHCDVMLCKETYCKDPHAVGKFGHHLEEIGWGKPERI